MISPAGGPWDLDTETPARALLFSHRGLALDLIENTDAAFAAGVDIGADGFETDVRVTADGVPVCHRDETLMRLGGKPDRILDLSFAAIKAAVPEICPLADALRYAAQLAIVLDIKAETDWEVARIAEVMEVSPNGRNVIAGTRTIGLSRLLAQRRPGQPQFSFGLGAADQDEFRANGGTWLRIAEPDLTEASAREARQRGFKFLVGIGEDYPGNIGPVTPDKIRRVMALRPDAIMLDDPRLFLDLYDSA